ncbi:MAG: SUMF1/EgtB/PvdO family nonheme iron enzyme, partial [Terriglobia bacterium]
MAQFAAAPARSTLFTRLEQARERTDELFRLLKPEAYYDRPIAERHRIIFYLGHVEAFDWNLLSDRALSLKRFNSGFDHLFAFGIDPIDGGLPSDRPKDWPAIEDIRHYNQQVRSQLDGALRTRDFSAEPSNEESSLAALLNVAIEHRLMHAETLAYMLHQLPPERKAARPLPSLTATKHAEHRMVEIPPGEATLGLPRTGDFGWDNEFETHCVKVPAFSIDAYGVTNGDFLRFMNAGGYESRNLWTDADWNWIRQDGIRHPALWMRAGNGWHYRTMFGEVPLPMEWPVYVSYAEASAYARWVEKSLPNEAEWHRAAYGTREGPERPFAWGEYAPDDPFGNFDFHHWDPCPVDAHPAGASAFGVNDLVGNGWEWTSTVFSPFPGFKPFPFYPGYSANFFDGQHYVLKGGSARTAACLLRRPFRNWFQA